MKSRTLSLIGHLAAVAILLLPTGCPPGQTPPPGPDEPQLLLVYARSGGHEALDDRLYVIEDGTAILYRGQVRYEFQLTPAELEQIQVLLAAAPFEGEEGESGQGGFVGADFMIYTVTHGDKTARATDLDMPEGLGPLVDQLNRVIDERAG